MRKARQRRPRKIVGALADEIDGRLSRFHSPVQINGFLDKAGYDAPSQEAIYEHIARDKKAGGDLYTNLRINGKRRYFGDWEVDLVEGSKGTGFILSMVERKSRFSPFRKLGNKKMSTVSEANVDGLRAMRVRTLTYENGLLRQYYAKGSSFEHVTAAGLQVVEDGINEGPRKTLEFSCPLDYLQNLSAA